MTTTVTTNNDDIGGVVVGCGIPDEEWYCTPLPALVRRVAGGCEGEGGGDHDDVVEQPLLSVS